MRKRQKHGRERCALPVVLLIVLLLWLPVPRVRADGCYIGASRAVAVSVDQRAIIVKNGREISMTFSTGYTGEGHDFGWIIPTPVPPAIQDVAEGGRGAETAFMVLDGLTAPIIKWESGSRGGCFPGGTEVLTPDGPRPIESIRAGVEIYAFDVVGEEWVSAKVRGRLTHRYQGDVVTLHIGDITVRATGNHPFCVVRGDRLALRPVPADVPPEEPTLSAGRWVEARDLQVGDLLTSKDRGDLRITRVASRKGEFEVYNLEIQRFRNYAVGRKGILVHNKGHAEASAAVGGSSAPSVTVHGRATLQHYELSVLGAADASALLDWLRENGYQADPAARATLDGYIDHGWAFVAVKLNPKERRHYENEFLPPLTIKFKSGRIVFPLRISSVSTAEPVRITLYVIGPSTAWSSNFPTAALRYEATLFELTAPDSEWIAPELYIERCIRETTESEDGPGLAVMWSGSLDPALYGFAIDQEQVGLPSSVSQRMFLTRLEGIIDPAAMTDDIRIRFDPMPKRFRVEIRLGGEYEQRWHEFMDGIENGMTGNVSY